MSLKQYYDEQFEGKVFTVDALLNQEYECCTFINCQFEEANLSGVVFINCDFEGCDLSMSKLYDTAFREARFKDCKMLGLRFDDCNSFLLEMHFSSCNLSMSSFYQLKLTGMQFANCNLKEVDFTETDAGKNSFENCEMTNAVFDRSNLEGADFTTSVGFTIDPDVNRIAKAKFSRDGALGLLSKYDIVIEG